MSNYAQAVNPYITSSNGIDPYKIASGQQKVDPELFKMYLAASMTNLDSILSGGSDNNSSDSGFLGGSSSSSDPFSSIMNRSSQSSSIFQSSNSVYEQMIAQSNLIGKNVEAYDPATKEPFSGKVTGVAVDGGQLYITVGEKKVPPEYLIAIKE